MASPSRDDEQRGADYVHAEAELRQAYNSAMKLYVCWGTFPVPWPRRGASWRPGAHPCKKAHDALTQAGHSPEVIKVYGFGQLPDLTSGRKKVRRLTGESFVPVLLLDDGELVTGSDEIVGWAQVHPAAGS